MLLITFCLFALWAPTSATVCNSTRHISYRRYAQTAEYSGGGSVDFEAFPQCALPYCNSTSALSPSRLGCINSTLTLDCLCKEAPTPLACVPSGPSSEDNCWYDVEGWFAGQCGNDVATIRTATMPACLSDCAINWLSSKGCATQTRNCFCKLDDKQLVSAVEQCRKSGCMKHMQPSFDVAFWREQICSQGDIDDYDQHGYDARKSQVKAIQIGVPVVVGLVDLVLVVLGAYLRFWGQQKRSRRLGLVCFGSAALLVLLIIPPIFVAI